MALAAFACLTVASAPLTLVFPELPAEAPAAVPPTAQALRVVVTWGDPSSGIPVPAEYEFTLLCSPQTGESYFAGAMILLDAQAQVVYKTALTSSSGTMQFTLDCVAYLREVAMMKSKPANELRTLWFVGLIYKVGENGFEVVDMTRLFPLTF